MEIQNSFQWGYTPTSLKREPMSLLFNATYGTGFDFATTHDLHHLNLKQLLVMVSRRFDRYALGKGVFP